MKPWAASIVGLVDFQEKERGTGRIERGRTGAGREPILSIVIFFARCCCRRLNNRLTANVVRSNQEASTW
jgi:hypothetical protein